MYVFCSYWPFLFQGGLSYLSLFSHKFVLCVIVLVMFEMFRLDPMKYKTDFTTGAMCITYLFKQLLVNVFCVTYFISRV